MCPTCGHPGTDHYPEDKDELGGDVWFCFARDEDDHACGCGDPRRIP